MNMEKQDSEELENKVSKLKEILKENKFLDEFLNNLKEKDNIINIISIWRPREKFHFGQYACIKTLEYFKKVNNNANIIIILGQDVDKYKRKELEEQTIITKNFINEYYKTENKPTIIESLIYSKEFNESQDRCTKVDNYSNSKVDTDFRNNIFSKDWRSHVNFFGGLIKTLEMTTKNLNFPIYIFNGEKHSWIWNCISNYLKDEIFKDQKKINPIYLNNIVDLTEKRYMSIKKSDTDGSIINQKDLIFIDENLFNLINKINNCDENSQFIKQILNIIEIDKDSNNDKIYEIDNNNKELIINYLYNLTKIWNYIIIPSINNTQWVTIDNKFLIEYIISKFNIYDKNLIDAIKPYKIEDIDDINENPGNFRKFYNILLNEILDHLEVIIKNKNKSLEKIYNKLKELIIKTKNIDIILFFTEKFHRDHYLHHFNVAALGTFLLDILVNDEETLLQELTNYLNENLKKYLNKQTRSSEDQVVIDNIDNIKIDENDFLVLWWLIALLHDHALPIEEIIRLIPLLYNLEITYVNSSNGCSLRESILGKFIEQLDGLIHEKLKETLKILLQSKKLEEEKSIDSFFSISHLTQINHAEIGAVNLNNFLDLKQEEENKQEEEKELGIMKDFVYEFVRQKIIEAIKFHNTYTNDIHLSSEPLIFLLILCDELQEWTRKQFPKDIKPKNEEEFRNYIKNPEKYMMHSIDNISIELFLINNNKYKYNENLSINFNHNDDEILNKLDWNENKFIADKRTRLSKLIFTENKRKKKYPKEISPFPKLKIKI